MKILALVTHIYKTGGIARYNCDILEAMASNPKVKEIIALSRDISNSRQSSSYPFKVIMRPSKIRYCLNALLIIIPTLFNAAARRKQCQAVEHTKKYVSIEVSLQPSCNLKDEGYIKNRAIDLIYCGHIHMMPLAIILAKLTKAPIWLQIYGIEAWQKPNILWEWLISHANRVLSISRYTRHKFCHSFNFDPHLVKLLSATVDDRFKPGSQSSIMLKKYGLEGKKIILTVSRLENDKYKGHDKILKILPKLLLDFPNLCYVIVGDGEDKIRLEKKIQYYNIANHVIFIGACLEKELPFIYQLANVYAMPSTGEGFGIVFLEAARCGLSVIAGNQDGSVDALREGELGYLVDPNDDTAIIQAITSALREEKKINTDSVHVFDKKNFTQHCHFLLENM